LSAEPEFVNTPGQASFTPDGRRTAWSGPGPVPVRVRSHRLL